MPSPKDPEKFLEQTGFSKEDLGEALAKSLNDFARLTPPATSQAVVPQTQMSKEIQDVAVGFPQVGKVPQVAQSGSSVGADPGLGGPLVFEIDVSGVVEDVVLFGYYP